MLVLTRRVGESINIGDGVVLTLLSIDRYQAKLGFEAPYSTKIVRTELADRIARGERKPERAPSGEILP